MYDAQDHILYGKAVGMGSAVITYQGRSLKELEKDFGAGVDHYLQICKMRQVAPVKPFNGKMLVKVSSELHEATVTAAMASTWHKTGDPTADTTKFFGKCSLMRLIRLSGLQTQPAEAGALGPGHEKD
jgi:predicted HicB family RNase H-like nuclease